MEYDGLFDFQLFLNHKYGNPSKDGPKIEKVPLEGFPAFFGELKARGLGEHLCVDIGSVATSCLDDVVFERDRLTICGRSDSRDFVETSSIPDGMQLVINADPRESYGLVHCRPASHEVRMGLNGHQRVSGGPNYVLFYPNGSSLMARTHQFMTLPDSTFVAPYSVSDDWSEIIFARVYRKVIGDLQRHYRFAKIHSIITEISAPVDGTLGQFNRITNYGAVTFSVKRSHGMKNDNLETWARLFAGKNLPFPVQVWCKPKPDTRIVDISILIEIPE